MKKIKHKNTKLIVAVAASLILVMSCAGILAYFTATDERENEWVIGYVDVPGTEEFDPPKEIIPGTSFTKNVTAENTGRNPAYVRFKVVFSDGDMEDISELDFNTEDYIYKDGYWYLEEPVEADAVSSSLFTTVTINKSASTNGIKDYDIMVYVEAYQANGFDTYEQAWAEYHKNK